MHVVVMKVYLNIYSEMSVDETDTILFIDHWHIHDKKQFYSEIKHK